MTKEFAIDRGRDRSLGRAGDDRELSGRVVAWLSLPEQFVLWAIRHRLASRRPGTEDPCLARGFLLAFGLSTTECAIWEFEDCFRLLTGFAKRDILLCPLGCGCVSADEERLFILFCPPPADVDATATQARVARALVRPEAVGALLAAAARFRGRLAACDFARLQQPGQIICRMLH